MTQILNVFQVWVANSNINGKISIYWF